ncbi:MAG: hypothetical protein U0324_03705 [Polyangiales bacterium]
MRNIRGTLVVVVVSALACKARGAPAGAAAANTSARQPAAPVDEAPEVVARRYLELGSRADLAGARALVVAECRQGPVGDVDAVKLMGGRMTLQSCETSVESRQGDDARVRYTVAGSVHSDGGTTTLFGAQVHVGGVNVENARQSGSLHLVRQGGRWLVTCR